MYSSNQGQIIFGNVKGLVEEFLTCPDDSVENLNKILSKIFNSISAADRFKKEAFLNLSDKGLHKLLRLLNDQNLEIRTNSFKVISLLLNNNEILQNIFCEKFNFNPVGNVILINWLPPELKNAIKINEHILYEIKKTQNDNLSNNTRLYWQWPPNDKYNNNLFPDPHKYLLGIYTTNRTIIPMPEKHFDDDFKIQDLIDKLENSIN